MIFHIAVFERVWEQLAWSIISTVSDQSQTATTVIV